MTRAAGHLAAIMFTDMAGSTTLAQSGEAEALRLQDEVERRVRLLFAAHQGREIRSKAGTSDRETANNRNTDRFAAFQRLASSGRISSKPSLGVA